MSAYRKYPPKNIVLDIDETLVKTYDDPGFAKLNGTNILVDPTYYSLRPRIIQYRLEDIPLGSIKKGQGIDNDMWSITRPHLYDFLAFCFDYFDNVIIWSAGLGAYVQAVVDKVFNPIGGTPYPEIVWARDQCVFQNGILTKPLNKLINDPLARNKGLTLENTLIIDDRVDNFIDNPSNGIQIPLYEPNPNPLAIATEDIALLQLKKWFLRDDVRQATDVQMLPKNQIFNTSL